MFLRVFLYISLFFWLIIEFLSTFWTFNKCDFDLFTKLTKNCTNISLNCANFHFFTFVLLFFNFYRFLSVFCTCHPFSVLIHFFFWHCRSAPGELCSPAFFILTQHSFECQACHLVRYTLLIKLISKNVTGRLSSSRKTIFFC